MKPHSSDFASTSGALNARRSVPNGRRNRGGRNDRPINEGRRISKNVHENINFSMLDEACLDVGKVDLSSSAKIRNDSGLSPQKTSRDTNGVVGSVDYHELETLTREQKRSAGLTNRATSSAFCDYAEEDWKGWSSSILFSQEYGCPFVRVKERSKVSEVLVMCDDLVDRECALLNKSKSYNFNRDNFVSKVFGSHSNEKKSLQEKNEELKKNVHLYFDRPEERNIFLESIDLSAQTSELQAPNVKKSFSRKLNFCTFDNDAPTNKKVDSTKTSKGHKNSGVSSDEEEPFLGYSNRAILSSEQYARRFRNQYEKVKCQTAMLI